MRFGKLPAIVLAGWVLVGCGGGDGGSSPPGTGAPPVPGAPVVPQPGEPRALSQLQSVWEGFTLAPNALASIVTPSGTAPPAYVFFSERTMAGSPAEADFQAYKVVDVGAATQSRPVPPEYATCGRSLSVRDWEWFSYVLNTRGAISKACLGGTSQIRYVGTGIEQTSLDDGGVPYTTRRITAIDVADVSGANIAATVKSGRATLSQVLPSPATFPTGAKTVTIWSHQTTPYVQLHSIFGQAPQPLANSGGTLLTTIEQADLAPPVFADISKGTFHTIGGRRVWIGPLAPDTAVGGQAWAFVEIDGRVFWGSAALPITESNKLVPMFNSVARDAIRAANLVY